MLLFYEKREVQKSEPTRWCVLAFFVYRRRPRARSTHLKVPPLPHPPTTPTHHSLHFGWVSCATLVNFNNYVALVPRFSDKGKLRFSLASIAAAVSLAVAVSGKTGDPVYAGVVAWALSAVASEKGWGRMKVRLVRE